MGVAYPKVSPDCRSARHLFTIWVDPDRRDAVLTDLQSRGVGVAVNYRAVHLLTYYRQEHGYRRGQFPVAERVGDSTITLPLYPSLGDAQVEYVLESVKAACHAPVA